MKIIFVGSALDEETLEARPDASVAGNKMQQGFIHGFIENGVQTEVLSVEPYAMWRMNHKPIWVKRKILAKERTAIQTIPFINLLGLKQLSIGWNLLIELLKRQGGRDTVVVVYNTMSMFATPVLLASKLKRYKTAAIVADLPILGKKSPVKKWEDKNQEKLIHAFQMLIPLTKQIPADFAPHTPYCVVEAGCNPCDYKKTAELAKSREEKQIVFSGTLNALSGIERIMQTMQLIEKENIVLHIYGDGDLRDFVEQSAQKNRRIQYHGRVSNDQMLKIQQQADLLVCPRSPDSYTTKYTFPSKILEYICAGVPVLSNHLAGIPEEYDTYINFAASDCNADWAKEIRHILQKEPASYREKAVRAREKVLQEKSWKKQCEKVVRFFESCQHDMGTEVTNDRTAKI